MGQKEKKEEEEEAEEEAEEAEEAEEGNFKALTPGTSQCTPQPLLS